MTEDEIASVVVDAAIKMHRTLGPGLLESVYETVLAFELTRRGLQVQRQVSVPIIYEGATLEEGFRADLLVEDKLLVELKSVEALLVHPKQLRTYLRRQISVLASC